MRSNVDLTQGAIMAEAVMMDMARRWGHEGAHRIVARASTRAAAEGLALDAALALDPEVAAVYPADELARLVSDPGSYLGTPDGVAPPSDP
jgi:3-carboxy-cis,cis-muconate cycloisomerase